MFYVSHELMYQGNICNMWKNVKKCQLKKMLDIPEKFAFCELIWMEKYKIKYKIEIRKMNK